MRWAVVAAAGAEGAGRAVADSLGLALGSDGEADGFVFVGDDHALAAFGGSRPSTPILPVAPGPSDLARMFGFGVMGLSDRLAAGKPYPTDLVRLIGPEGSTLVIGHVTASANGRIPRWWARSARITTTRRSNTHCYRASGLVIANTQHAWGMTVAPRAAVMDGRAEIQIIGGTSSQKARSRRAMARGLHLRLPGIERRVFDEIELVAPPGWRVMADRVEVPGGMVGARVEPAALTLWV